MLHELHFAAIAPAGVSACCALLGGGERRVAGFAALLSLAAMIATAVSPVPATYGLGVVALWVVALCETWAIRRAAASRSTRVLAWHRVGGTAAMALVMLSMALGTIGMGASAAAGGHAHLGASVDGHAWLLAIALAASLAFGVHSGFALWHVARGGAALRPPPRATARILHVTEITSMLLMVGFMCTALIHDLA